MEEKPQKPVKKPTHWRCHKHLASFLNLSFVQRIALRQWHSPWSSHPGWEVRNVAKHFRWSNPPNWTFTRQKTSICVVMSQVFSVDFLFYFGRPFELETFGRSPIISKHIVDVQGPGNHLWYIPSTSFMDKVFSFVFHHPNLSVKSLLSHCTRLYSTIFI